MSVADTKFRSFLPGEIGNFEDDNVLSIFKNTTDSKFSLSKLSKKRISKAMFMKTKHDTDTEQTYGYKFGNSRKGSIRSKKSKLMTIRQQLIFNIGNEKYERAGSTKKMVLGSPKDSIPIESVSTPQRSNNLSKSLKSPTKATISEPVSHTSSNNWLNPTLNKDEEEEEV